MRKDTCEIASDREVDNKSFEGPAEATIVWRSKLVQKSSTFETTQQTDSLGFRMCNLKMSSQRFCKMHTSENSRIRGDSSTTPVTEELDGSRERLGIGIGTRVGS
jgi:hypothetical protein